MNRDSDRTVLVVNGDEETLARARQLLASAGITGEEMVCQSGSSDYRAGKPSNDDTRYRDLFKTSRDGILFTDLNGRIEDANPAFLEMVGYPFEEVCDMFEQQMTPEKWRLLESRVVSPALLSQGESGDYEKEYIRKNGTRVPAQVRSWLLRDDEGEPLRKLTLVRDTSARKSLEVQLRQAQKMEALGTLAGGIAHDFNNVLAAILGYIELARFDVDEASPARKSIDQIYKASQRARNLVGHILSFSRQTMHEKRPVFMQQIISESLELLRASLPSTIEIKQSMTSKMFPIEADGTQIHQILMNLCTNASHAMPDGGTLSIVLDVVTFNELEAHGFVELEPGAYMKLWVKDTGCGMDPEVKKRIFDPYFTTKGKGQGTGMGLSVVHGILKVHGGAVHVESEVGEGSSFYLYFPICKGRAGEEAVAVAGLARGHERILFVDDEPDLAELGMTMLERLGYTVTSVTDSQKALELFSASPDKYDLIVTDLTMPKMTGVPFARKVKSVRPDVPVIICTGYSDSVSAGEVSDAGIDYLLMKPLEIRELSASIRNALTYRGTDEEDIMCL
ncbi:hypothetical protein DSLASN_21430 [Desulfoluna limicola]|uniref:histidine kinase n=1 Tax=Desulfoluna limicola TaxID=2810562 RepID=A0ABN6F4G5_9BACT|nr:response regulator [Desulfoluna limicola]BCS96511.1 hypothetical protein DSLASN_21430 [Desulfoluna limicola]